MGGIDLAALAAKNKTQENPNETKADSGQTSGSNAKSESDGKDVTSGTGHEVVSSDSQPEGEGVHWASRIPNYSIGKFRFENGQLHLTDSNDQTEFERLVSKLPASEKAGLRKIDVEAAHALSRELRGASGLTTQSDSSVGRRRDTINGEPVVGTEDIANNGGVGVEGHAKLAQRDNNMPVTGTNVVTEANATDLAQGDGDAIDETSANNTGNDSQ